MSATRDDLDRLIQGFNAAFPQEWRDAVARQGYMGKRCGWYPAKPERRRKETTR